MCYTLNVGLKFSLKFVENGKRREGRVVKLKCDKKIGIF